MSTPQRNISQESPTQNVYLVPDGENTASPAGPVSGTSEHGQPQAILSEPRAPESSRTTENKELHDQLFKILKEKVKDVTLALKQQAPAEQPPQNVQRIEAADAPEGSSRRVRGRTTLTGDTSVSFDLPQNLLRSNYLDLEMLVPQGEEESTSASPSTQNIQRKFTFGERLLDWKVECRRRSNGKTFDMYYQHLGERKIKFRSVVEVVRFIMYEVYPPILNKGKAVMEDEPTDENKSERKIKTCTSRPLLIELDGVPLGEAPLGEYLFSSPSSPSPDRILQPPRQTMEEAVLANPLMEAVVGHHQFQADTTLFPPALDWNKVDNGIFLPPLPPQLQNVEEAVGHPHFLGYNSVHPTALNWNTAGGNDIFLQPPQPQNMVPSNPWRDFLAGYSTPCVYRPPQDWNTGGADNAFLQPPQNGMDPQPSNPTMEVVAGHPHSSSSVYQPSNPLMEVVAGYRTANSVNRATVDWNPRGGNGITFRPPTLEPVHFHQTNPLMEVVDSYQNSNTTRNPTTVGWNTGGNNGGANDMSWRNVVSDEAFNPLMEVVNGCRPTNSTVNSTELPTTANSTEVVPVGNTGDHNNFTIDDVLMVAPDEDFCFLVDSSIID